MLQTIIYGVLIGIIASFFWGTSFGIIFKTSLLVGGLVGAFIGLLVNFFGKLARTGGGLERGEIVFVNSSILTIFGVFVIGTGVVVWLVRLIFF